MDLSPPAPRQVNSPSALTALVGFFLLLCSAICLAVTLADAWRENSQSKWPRVSAAIESREVREDDGTLWTLMCRVRFEADGRTWRSSIRSRGTRSRADADRMETWVDEHEVGSAIAIRYDPSDPATALFAGDDVPRGGPRSPDDAWTALAFLALGGAFLAVAAVLRAFRH